MCPLAPFAELCLEHVRSGIAVFDRDMRYLFANPAWSRHFELGERELVGHSHYDIVPDLPERWRGVHRRCLEGAHEHFDRDQFVRVDGTTMWIDWEVFPWRTDDGAIGGLVIVSETVTEQVRLVETHAELQRMLAERDEALAHERVFNRRLEALRRSALAISALGVRPPTRSTELLQLILDQARILTAADYGALGVGTNPERRFEPWLWSGLTEAQAAAMGAASPRPVGLLGKIAREGTTVRLDTIAGAPGAVGLPPGHVPLGPLLGVPIRQHGESIGNLYLGKQPDSPPFSVDDVSIVQLLADHAAVAVENATLYEQVRDQVRAREEVLAVVSHDLKNPLNAIALREQLLARQHGEAVELHTSAVSRSINEMRRMVLGLLDVASLDVGKLQLHLRAVDIAGLVDEVAENVRPLAEDRQLDLDLDVDGVGTVSLDRERMWQVLSNLVGNAIKFTPSGGRIAIRSRRDATKLSISVSDTGPGIASDVLPHVFDRYFTTTERGNHGTGLGLYIVKGLVEAHGGQVQVESEPGHGTQFSIAIPAL